MLSCRQVTEQADRLVDGELGWRARLALRVHLAMCRHCRRYVHQLELLIATLRRRAAADEAAVPPGFVDAVLRSLDAARATDPAP